MMPSIMSGSLIRATPPCTRMSAGTRSRAMTATAPASSAILACSAVTTSMMTPPLSISAMPRLTRAVPSSGCSLTASIVRRRHVGGISNRERGVVDLEVMRLLCPAGQVERAYDAAVPYDDDVADGVVVEAAGEPGAGHRVGEDDRLRGRLRRGAQRTAALAPRCGGAQRGNVGGEADRPGQPVLEALAVGTEAACLGGDHGGDGELADRGQRHGRRPAELRGRHRPGLELLVEPGGGGVEAGMQPVLARGGPGRVDREEHGQHESQSDPDEHYSTVAALDRPCRTLGQRAPHVERIST